MIKYNALIIKRLRGVKERKEKIREEREDKKEKNKNYK